MLLSLLANGQIGLYVSTDLWGKAPLLGCGLTASVALDHCQLPWLACAGDLNMLLSH